MKTHSHVFTVSKSLVQPDGDNAVRALRLHMFEDMVRNSAGKVSTSEMQYLDLTVSHQQEAYLTTLQKTERDDPAFADFDRVLKLPKLVEKTKLQKKRMNQIGEAFHI